jgi:ABC-2 type transport system permease protein
VAVYKQRYTAYEGFQTPRWSRFLIVTRSAFPPLFRRWFLTIYMVLCLFYPVVCVLRIYLAHNEAYMLMARLVPQLLAINDEFFYGFCVFQGWLALFLTAFVSPSLISWDMADGGLPLYFCRPFTRLEYVLGKLGVLLPLLSLITWIPGLALYALEGSLSGWTWTTENAYIARSVFLGLGVWILLLSLIGLALSASVKWRIAAGAVFIGVFFGGAGFGAAINSTMGITSGSLINLSQVMHAVWGSMLRYDTGLELSVTASWVVLALVSAISLWLLRRRIRTFEVIR